MRNTAIHIGTSGWHYKHWSGTFYPQHITGKKQLDYYQQQFDTVELNNTFYHLPALAAVRSWYAAVPQSFVFSVKGSRFITHVKKLDVTTEVVHEFLHRIDHLGNKLGPLLFQLPPNWKCNPERLQQFLERLPQGYRYTFEFRNPDWYRKEVYQLLEQYHCAFCIYELAGHRSPVVSTSGFVYIRLHGPGQRKYEGKYSNWQLGAWVKKCRQWLEGGKEVFLYFDNDQFGYAAMNARYMKEKFS